MMALSTEHRSSLRDGNMYVTNTNRVEFFCHRRSYDRETQSIGTAGSRRISLESRHQRVCRSLHFHLVILHLPHLLIIHCSPKLSSTSPDLGVHTAITTTNHEHQLYATRFLTHPIRPQLELELQVLRTKLVWKQLCAMESPREKIHWIGSGIFIVEADEEERGHDGYRRGRGLQGWDLGRWTWRVRHVYEHERDKGEGEGKIIHVEDVKSYSKSKSKSNESVSSDHHRVCL